MTHRRISTGASILMILIVLVSSACQSATPQAPTATNSPTSTNLKPTSSPTTPATPAAEVIFGMTAPEGTPPGSKVQINLLDEVTGLSINPTTYQMEATGGLHYQVKLPIKLGALIKYRYSLTAASNPEYTSMGQPVRYRLIQVEAPESVEDTVSAWKDVPGSASVGQITGQVIDDTNQAPIPGIMMAVGGQQVLTASDGSFQVSGLPEGTHNLVAYSLDGSYTPYQQGARILSGMTTPALIRIHATERVNVTFHVTTPSENVVGLPVRLAGNLLSLGDTFANLEGGLSTIASRMPLLTQQGSNAYSLTLNLPVGTYLEYKYTLGDGFWNAELTQAGQFNLRHLVVPNHDLSVDDQVTNWHTPGYSPVTINLTAPGNTPAGESVSIQFNPFGWTTPLPMWPLGNNRYLFIMYNPLNFSGNLSYRFCRNDQCGNLENRTYTGESSAPASFHSATSAQSFTHEIANWDNWQSWSKPTSVAAADIIPRGSDFIAGVQFLPFTDPSWSAYIGPVYQNLKSIGSGWVFLTPTWSYQSNGNPIPSSVPGSDPLWSDMVSTIQSARNRGLQVGLYPQLHMPGSASWWLNAPRDAKWWDSWFAGYRTFILNYADLAAQTGAGALVIGGDQVAPTFPLGRMVDGSLSGVPIDAVDRWQALIQEVRQHFQGTLLWSANSSDDIKAIPSFANLTDQLYLQFSPPLVQDQQYTLQELEAAFNEQLDQNVLPIFQEFLRPIVLSVDYPSAVGAAQGCAPGQNNTCIPFSSLDITNPDLPTAQVDLQGQVDIYNALFSSINSHDWVGGIISNKFYPLVQLQDASGSVDGKPAMDVLWYWFSRMTSTGN